MERRGAYVGKKAFASVKAKLSRQLKVLDRKVQIEAGVRFNLDAPQQLAKVLFERRGLPVIDRSEKTGDPSTAKPVLTQLATDYKDELCVLMLERRALSKLYTTYVIGIENRLTKQRRLHSSFRQARVVTGRLSSSNPNLENIPKSGPIKSMFVAPRCDWFIIAADLSQAELRFMAVYSGDANLLADLRAGGDLHQLTGELIFGRSDLSDEERRHAKTVNFGVLYGKDPATAGEEASISAAVMADYFKTFFTRYTDVKRALENIPKHALKHGFVQSPLGRKRRFDVSAAEAMPGGIGHLRRQAVNAIPQGAASDINCLAAIRIQKLFEKRRMRSYVWNMVHDSVLAYCPGRELVTSLKIVHKELVRTVPELNYSFPAEIGFGYSWEEAEKNQGSISKAIKRAERIGV
jgi:DNA polymerase-1